MTRDSRVQALSQRQGKETHSSNLRRAGGGPSCAIDNTPMPSVSTTCDLKIRTETRPARAKRETRALMTCCKDVIRLFRKLGEDTSSLGTGN
jgi:hypothetical protein